tara:strand:+ start:1011 stop:1334 length:324 start_codon:yes stop_codon:yes gene_type:complete
MDIKIQIKANSIYKRLQIWNGIFDLTNKELEVLSAFIKVNMKAKRKNMCSKGNKDEVANILQFEDPNTLNNYIKRLKDKGAFTYKKGVYDVNKMLNPKITKIDISII